MKILIKAQYGTYVYLDNKEMTHVSFYWNFLHRNIWSKQGYDVKFIGREAKGNDIISSHEGYDLLFFRGINSYKAEEKYVLNLLTEFKGIKILYLEACKTLPFMKHFDRIVFYQGRSAFGLKKPLKLFNVMSNFVRFCFCLRLKISFRICYTVDFVMRQDDFVSLQRFDKSSL